MRMTKLKVFIVILFVIINMMQLISFASSEKILIVKENEDNYFIYIEDVLDKEFQFAFSNDANESNLDYINSVKDTDGNNVAYIDAGLKVKFFASNQAYFWVKTNDEIKILNAASINLTEATTDEENKKINEMSKKITINADAESEKITINGEDGETYYYKMFSIGSSEEYKKFVSLIDEISKQDDSTDIYTKIKSYKELNDLYNKLIPEIDDTSWVEVKKLEIEKPYDAQEEQQYVLWLKDSKGTRDFQILTAYQKTVKSVEIKEKVVETTSALPVTYDNTSVLYMSLGIVIIAIVTMVIIKTKIAKKENRK